MNKLIKIIINQILIFIWKIKKIPFSIGYGFARKKKILTLIEDKNTSLDIYQVKGLDERLVEYKWIFQYISKVKSKTILDAGSTLNFDFLLEKIDRSNRIFIQTLYPETTNFNYLNVNYIYEDLKSSIFINDFFDYIICISTLEHIGFDNSFYNHNKIKTKVNDGNDKKYLDVIIEFKRILKINGKLLITVPFGKKIIFNHLQQFDIDDVKKIIDIFKPSRYSLRFFTYKDFGWIEVKYQDCSESLIRVDYSKQTEDHLASARSICLIELYK